MRLKQEQVVFLGSILLLGLTALSLDRTPKSVRGKKSADKEMELTTFETPDLSTVLPGEERLQSKRALFHPPSDTRALPPLDLVEPPREPLPSLSPATSPGPSPRAFGMLLRHHPQTVEAPNLFDVLEDSVPTEVAAEELGSAMSDGALETPAQEVARQEGYRDRYDWILRRSGTTVYGRIVNEDRYGLVTEAGRGEEALRFIQVDPETGREKYASVGAPAISMTRDSVGDFGFARTPSNEIELKRRRLGSVIDAGNRTDAMALAERCLEVLLEAPQALETAKSLFQGCSESDPEDVDSARGLARAHAAGFEFEEALSVFAEVEKQHPGDVRTQIGLAAIEERFLLIEEAEDRLRRASGFPVDAWRARWALGRFLSERDRPEEALPLLAYAALESPQDPASMYLRVAVRNDLGAAHLALGDAVEAGRVFAQALGADPGSEQAIAGLRAARLYGAGASASQATGRSGGFELALVSGIEAIGDGRFTESLEFLRSAAQLDPLRANEALAALSYLAEVTGHPDEALEFVQEALEHTPDHAWSLFQLGRLLADQDDYEGARDALLGALAIEPDFEDALVALGDAAFRLGRFEDAERYLERALSLEEARADVNALRGLNALRLGSSTAAAEFFARAAALHPDDSTAQAGLAWCAYLEGDATEARVLLSNLDRARRDEGEDDSFRVWSREQIQRIADHEEKVEWLDTFDRRSLRNGWTLREGVGPLVSLRDGVVHVEGVFAEDGRTSIFREYPASRFVSFEISLWVDPATTVRTGIYVARERQRRDANDTLGEVSLSRHKDGALELAFVRKGVPTETVEVPEPFPLGRWVRLRVEREGEASDSRVSLFLDGIPLIEGAPFAALGRAASPLQAGVFLEGEPGRRALLKLDDAAVVYRE